MAENEAHAKEVATPADAAPAPPPKSKGNAWLPLVVALVIASAAGFAAGYLLIAPRISAAFVNRPPASKPGGKDAKGAKESVFRIDNVVVNPAGSEGARFLMASIAIAVPDDKALDKLRENDAQIRDMVTSILESKTMTALTRPGARDSIKSDIARVIQPIAQCATRVYLPHFVIQ